MADFYREILERVSGQQSVTLRTELSGNEGSVKDGLHRVLTEVDPFVDAHGRRFARVRSERNGDGWTVTEPFLPPERLLLLGGGHVSLPTCEIAARCGFQVTVVDDREEFANRERFPLATEVLCEDYQEAIRRAELTANDYVVIVTRGHKCDTESLRTVLEGPAPAYVGMIGSRKRVREQVELLRSEGFDESLLSRVCSPIGLSIGAVTPEEIAVSIMAEVISYRRLAQHGGTDRLSKDCDTEKSVIEYLADHSGPRAVVTLLETHGSSPRKAGAKMVVGPDGLFAGTVGGGLGEAELIREAMDLIGSGRFRVLEMDLNGSVPDADELVCGGKVLALLEDDSE